MGQIVDLQGIPFPSQEEIAKAKEAEVTKEAPFHVPSIVGQAARYLGNKGYGYAVIIINPNKKNSHVFTNINGPNADVALAATIDRYYHPEPEQPKINLPTE